MPLSSVPDDLEEMTPRELTRSVRELVRKQVETHQLVYALKRFVHEEYVMPELRDLDRRADETEAQVSELRAELGGLRKDLGAIKSGVEALTTIGMATNEMMLAFSKRWGIPTVPAGGAHE